MSLPATTGLIFNIQRDSTEDGPGIRTTVFLKGCSMHCPWCHNPESIKAVPELEWYETRCIDYPELAIKGSAFSFRFVDLTRGLQHDVIAGTEFSSC